MIIKIVTILGIELRFQTSCVMSNADLGKTLLKSIGNKYSNTYKIKYSEYTIKYVLKIVFRIKYIESYDKYFKYF